MCTSTQEEVLEMIAEDKALKANKGKETAVAGLGVSSPPQKVRIYLHSLSTCWPVPFPGSDTSTDACTRNRHPSALLTMLIT